MARDNLGVAPSATTDLVRKVDLTAANTAFTPTGDIAATDVQAAIAEICSEAFPVGWGTWTSYTPTLTQGVTVTKTVTVAEYTQIGKTVIGKVRLVVTGAGTAGQQINVGLPVTPDASGTQGCDFGFVIDTSAATIYPGFTLVDTTGTCRILSSSSGGNLGSQAPFTLALASGDTVSVAFTYQST